VEVPQTVEMPQVSKEHQFQGAVGGRDGTFVFAKAEQAWLNRSRDPDSQVQLEIVKGGYCPKSTRKTSSRNRPPR